MTEIKKRGIFFIGDPHFQEKAFTACESLVEKCIAAIDEIRPSLIIGLGDWLDTHERAKQAPWSQVCNFIELLSQRAPTIVQIGNHDLIDQTQFLTDKHFFNPLKKWKDVSIVDVPTVFYIDDDYQDYTRMIIACPYVPPKRLIEALDVTLSQKGIDWTAADIIGCHQEFRRAPYRGYESKEGDEWLPSFPVAISGHIHTACDIGDNIMYVGSSRQVAVDEQDEKRVWHVLFSEAAQILSVEELDGYERKGDLLIKKIDLGMKRIKEIYVEYDDVGEFDYNELEHNYIKMHLQCLPEQYKVFRKSAVYKDLVAAGVTVSPKYVNNEQTLDILLGVDVRANGTLTQNGERPTVEAILRSVVKTKTLHVQETYKHLVDDSYRPDISTLRLNFT